MNISEEVRKLYREIYARQKAEMEECYEDVSEYEKEYDSHFSGYEKTVEIVELVSAVRKSDLVYVGIDSAISQTQDTLLHVLNATNDQRIVLGLGLIFADHQDFLDQYMSKKIDEEIFLNKIGHGSDEYDFNWEDQRTILEFCKKHEIKVVALNSRPKSQDPDEACNEKIEFAAKKIRDIDSKVIVAIGELHVAKSHLPSKVDAENDLIIYQNNPQIYWQLIDQGLEQKVDLVRIDENSYCITEVNPIIIQQNYLCWQNDEEVAKANQIKNMIQRISKYLGLEVSTDDLEVYGVESLDLFLPKIEDDYDNLRSQIVAGESMYLPEINTIYLGDLSIVHIAEEAAHYVNLQFSEEHKRTQEDDFYMRVMREALGYFGSKIIYEDRECEDIEDMDEEDIDEKLMAANILGFSGIGADRHLELAHELGYALGERMFYAIEEGDMEKNEVSKLFQDKFEDNTAKKTYFKLMDRLFD